MGWTDITYNGPDEFGTVDKWIQDHAKPWDFVCQEDKPCYNEGSYIVSKDNPVWSMEQGSGCPVTPTHHPCGYWTKKYIGEELTPPKANIYGCFSNDSSIYGLYFNGKTLSRIGKYQSPTDSVNGIVWYAGNLLTVGSNAGGKFLRQIDRITFEPIEDSGNFLEYDISSINRINLVQHDNRTFIDSGADYTIIECNNLARTGRGVSGSVIDGTNDRKYIARAYYWDLYWGNVMYQPVIGPNWSDVFEKIEDGVFDGEIASFWINPCYPTANSESSMIYYDNYLYVSKFTSPNSNIMRIKAGSFEIKQSVNTDYSHRMIVYNDKIYTLCGVNNCKIAVYDADTLAFIKESSVLENGRAFGDLVVMGNYLVVVTSAYGTDYGGLYKIDRKSLKVKDKILFSDPVISSYQRLCKIDDQYVVAGRLVGTSVFDIEHMVLIDDVGVDGTSSRHSGIVVQTL